MIGFSAAPRYVEAIKRIFGDEEVVPPGISLESDRPEWAHVKREVLWTSGLITVAGAAGFNSMVEIFNPPGSQVLCTITEVRVLAAGATLYSLTLDGGLGTVPAAVIPRDTRAPIPGIVSRIMNTALISGIILDRSSQAVAGADLLFDEESPGLPFILGPNHRLNIWNGTVNSAITAIFGGRVRRATAEELAD